jgi:hypothetical protein
VRRTRRRPVTPASIIGNVVEGAGDISNRLNPATYPIRDAAIIIVGDTAVTTAVVRNNVLSGAARGLQTFGALLTVTGTDNVIRRSRDALAIRGASRVTMRRSDITDYASAVFYDFPPGTVGPLQPGDLACNWWGASTGPAGAFGVACGF